MRSIEKELPLKIERTSEKVLARFCEGVWCSPAFPTLIAGALDRWYESEREIDVLTLIHQIKDVIPFPVKYLTEERIMHMRNFYKSIRACFQYDRPAPLNLFVDWNCHQCHTETREGKIQCSSSSSWFTPNLSIKSTFSPVDTGVTLTQNQQKLKKCAYQTMDEIYFIYAKSNSQGIIHGICLDFYAKSFETINKAKTNADVLASLAQFKIACWKAADLIFQGKKFS